MHNSFGIQNFSTVKFAAQYVPAITSFKPIDLILYVSLPALMITILALTSDQPITVLAWFSSFTLFTFSWASFLIWRRGTTAFIPLFSLLSFIYCIYFVLPLFWGERDTLKAGTRSFQLTDEIASTSMLLVLLGVASLGIGMNIGAKLSWLQKLPTGILQGKKSWIYIYIILLVGIIANSFPGLQYILGEEGRQVVLVIQKDLPLIAYGFLFRKYVKGQSNLVDKVLMLVFILTSFINGVSSVWLGAFVMIIVLSGIILIAEKRKIPYSLIVFLIIYILFFQVGKSNVREKYWYNEEEGTKIERIEFWLDTSLERWKSALAADDSSDESNSTKSLIAQSLDRGSLLNQTGNVLEMTPKEVPYQYGRLYSYLLVSLIPRFVWPGKPSVNEANQFYQVAYGLTEEDNLDSVSIAVGALTESYINFGWFGPLTVMFGLGILLGFIQKIFLDKNSGEVFNVIGVALIPYLIIIEAQMAQYLGGLIQKVAMILLLLAPITYYSKIRRPMMNQQS